MQTITVTNLHEVDNLLLVVSTALGELRQPDLPPVPGVEHLQPLHHLVRLTAVVVSGQVVDPAAQGLASLDIEDGRDGRDASLLPRRRDQTSWCFLQLELG